MHHIHVYVLISYYTSLAYSAFLSRLKNPYLYHATSSTGVVVLQDDYLNEEINLTSFTAQYATTAISPKRTLNHMPWKPYKDEFWRPSKPRAKPSLTGLTNVTITDLQRWNRSDNPRSYRRTKSLTTLSSNRTYHRVVFNKKNISIYHRNMKKKALTKSGVTISVKIINKTQNKRKVSKTEKHSDLMKSKHKINMDVTRTYSHLYKPTRTNISVLLKQTPLPEKQTSPRGKQVPSRMKEDTSSGEQVGDTWIVETAPWWQGRSTVRYSYPPEELVRTSWETKSPPWLPNRLTVKPNNSLEERVRLTWEVETPIVDIDDEEEDQEPKQDPLPEEERELSIEEQLSSHKEGLTLGDIEPSSEKQPHSERTNKSSTDEPKSSMWEQVLVTNAEPKEFAIETLEHSPTNQKPHKEQEIKEGKQEPLQENQEYHPSAQTPLLENLTWWLPSVDQAIPSVDQAVPSVDEAVPSVGEAVPSVDEAVASGDEELPSDVEAAPDDQGPLRQQLRSRYDDPPQLEEEPPVDNEEQPPWYQQELTKALKIPKWDRVPKPYELEPVSNSSIPRASVQCYVCGLNDYGLAIEFQCKPFYKKDPQSGRKLRVQSCGTNNYLDGCFYRYIDLSFQYAERGCRTFPPARGKSYASKRLRRLEFQLEGVKEGCIGSPAAALTPMSKAISLFAFYYACVCQGDSCNSAISKNITPVPISISVFISTFCYKLLSNNLTP